MVTIYHQILTGRTFLFKVRSERSATIHHFLPQETFLPSFHFKMKQINEFKTDDSRHFDATLIGIGSGIWSSIEAFTQGPNFVGFFTRSATAIDEFKPHHRPIRSAKSDLSAVETVLSIFKYGALKKIIGGIYQSLGVIYHTVYLIFYTVKLQHSYQYTGMVNNTIRLTLCDTVPVWRSRLTSMVISSIQMLRQTL